VEKRFSSLNGRNRPENEGRRGKMTDHENENEAQATIEMTIGNNQIDFQLQ
jgi:hypothetical protein